jgi:hypothetical protein
MTKIDQAALAALVTAIALAGACGSGKSGKTRGTGGTAGAPRETEPAHGIGGATRPATGTGGVDAATGGKVSGGNGGGLGTGGTIVGTAGRSAGGKAAAGALGGGGRGLGGIGAGGTGAGGTGGTGPLDAGCTGTTCTTDASTSIDGAPSCSQLLLSTECDLRKDCHSVFVDPQNCTCTEESCCMRFDHCADGDKADCIGPALCNMVAPVCEGQYYTVGIRGGCYEGCVRKHECTVPACPAIPPADQASCAPVDHPCFYEDCAGQGRTLATCAGGKWTVQTSACDPVNCAGVGVTPAALTCAAGEVCVRTSTSNVVMTIKPSCVANTCGEKPISPECIGGLSGTCTVEVSASGGDIYCILPPPCSGAGGCDYGASP